MNHSGNLLIVFGRSNCKLISGLTASDQLKIGCYWPVVRKWWKQLSKKPISLLTSFSKIIEKLIYTRLISFIEANNLLVQEQYGFRPHSSTDYINDLPKLINKNNNMVLFADDTSIIVTY
jgi:hypothetical protein